MTTLMLVAGAVMVVAILGLFMWALFQGTFFTTIWWFWGGGAEAFGMFCELLGRILAAIFESGAGGSD